MHPSPLLAAWTDRLPRGRALDVACGLGRNAIHLAANGYAVDAMDISGVALAKARERASAAGVEVNWIEADLEQPDIARGAYDVIVVARFLDRPLIPRLIDALRPGGTRRLRPSLHHARGSRRAEELPVPRAAERAARAVPCAPGALLRGRNRRRPRREPYGPRAARRLQGLAGVLSPQGVALRTGIAVSAVMRNDARCHQEMKCVRRRTLR